MAKFTGRLITTAVCATILVLSALYLRAPVQASHGNEEGGGLRGRWRDQEALGVQGPLRNVRNEAPGPSDNEPGNTGDTYQKERAKRSDGEHEANARRRSVSNGSTGGRLMGPAGAERESLPDSALRMAPAGIDGHNTTYGSGQRVPGCDDECARFGQLLERWPSAKPKAAIYLLTHSSRLSYLKRILSQIDQYFNDRFAYPVIIFHEKDLRAYRSTVRAYSASDVYFQEVYFTLPDFLAHPVVFNIPCTSHISYRHMCRFHAKGVYEEPIMRGLDLVWRLDDDSELLRRVPYDVFAHMVERRYRYGYVILHWDATVCTTGLWKATEAHIAARNITPKFFGEWAEPRLYYNNFEISSLSLWMSRGYRDYIEYLDRLGGIFYHRWGDAPIKGIAVSLFLNKNETHLFADIAYRHRSMQNTEDDSS